MLKKIALLVVMFALPLGAMAQTKFEVHFIGMME